jgi:hypothetical protein
MGTLKAQRYLKRDRLESFGNNERNGYNWGHYLGDARGYMEIHGGTTWGGHIKLVSVLSGTGTTLVVL